MKANGKSSAMVVCDSQVSDHELDAPPAKKANRETVRKATAKVQPMREPLPTREGRNEHPGNVQKATPQRTSQEVAAE